MTDRPTTLQTVRTLGMLADTVAVQQAADDAAFLALRIYDDIGLDSLEVVQLGMEIEEAFGIEDGIPDAEMDGLVSVADIVALIERVTK